MLKKQRVNTVESVNTEYLESLTGYNTRRAALAVQSRVGQGMEAHGLTPVEFSVLSLIRDNPGIAAFQVCETLAMLQPNLVGILRSLDKRALIEKRRHSHDGRAHGLYLRPAGSALMRAAERTVAKAEKQAFNMLTASQNRTLSRLLKKLYH